MKPCDYVGKVLEGLNKTTIVDGTVTLQFRTNQSGEVVGTENYVSLVAKIGEPVKETQSVPPTPSPKPTPKKLKKAK